MLHQVSSRVGAGWLFFLTVLFAFAPCALAQSTDVRIMSANLNGNAQTYQPFALRIFQGLKPDVVAIQEFNYNGNSPADIRSMVDTAFGTNFVYFRETNSGYSIPNGVISRYPIVNSGSWPDAEQSQPNRGFAWAQIDLPGTNDLYIVSVHLLTSSATARGNEAAALKNLIQANFPAGAWVVVAGDFNTDSRTESAMVTFDSFLSDNPIPADNNGDADTSQNRNHPHDYVLPSFAFTNVETASVFSSHSFPNGLVFDSTVYTPLSDVSPVQFGDSTNAQHMAVIKDFLVSGADSSSTNPPSLSAQPLDRGVSVGSNVLFSVTASGATPLSFQWYFNTNTVLAGATNSALTVTNAQLTNAGTYSVIVTNNFGGITSSIATLIVTNAAPVITTQPQNQFATPGGSATFSVAANGTAPIGYQWFFNTNTAIAGAITNFITITNAQFTNAGAYSVLVTNSVGSVTSAVATLTISVQSSSATNIVISQIYGGGGNASATYKNDFVELFNPTASAISVSGWSVQYAGATGTSWQAANLSGTIEPYHYYLVQLASGGTAGNPLPLPDSTGGMNISASNGKLALVASTTALTGSNPLGTSSIIDFVGFGTGNAYEGSAAATGAPASNNTTAILRKNGGFADSNDNTNDFTTVSPPAPRDSATPPNNPSVSPAAAALGGPSFGMNSFSFTVVGTAGSNYVIQVASNLSGGNWVSVFTNAAPFTFTDSNASAFPQEFYRAVASP